MKAEVNQNLADRAEQILFHRRRAEIDSLIENPDNRFAHTFLAMLHLKGYKVHPIDEARLHDREHQLDYLQTAEQVRTQEIRLEPGWYRQNIGTFMGYLEPENQPVILEYKRGGYTIYDPVENTRTKLSTALISRISQYGLFVFPSYEGKHKSGCGLLLRLLIRQKKEMAIFLLVLLFASLVTILVPIVAGYITTALIPREDLFSVIQITVVLLLGIAGAFCLHVVVNRAKSRIQTTVGDHFFSVLYAKILDMSPEGENQIADRLVNLTLPLLNSAGTLIGAGAGVLVYLVQCILILNSAATYYSPIRNVFYLMVLGEVLLILGLQTLSYLKTKQQLDKLDTLSGQRREMIDNISTIKGYGMEDRAFYRYAMAFEAYMKKKLEKAGISEWLSVIGTIAGSLGILIVFQFISVHDWNETGQISTLITSFTLVAGYLVSLGMSAGEAANNLPYMKLADVILSEKSEHNGAEGASFELKGGIELQNVTFAYGKDATPVIRGISTTIRPGEQIGITGSSGCGKSTLIRLMLGFLQPTSGSICYDGRDISQCDLAELRRQFGVVLQHASLITGNIRMNIGMSEDADMDKVIEAARNAAVLEDIEAMPMKFNTMLSSESELVSGGQKQRIALARAMINHPKILFLDEATSAMDNVTQQRVKENLDKLGITRIMVAHRLSTLKDCDRILVMDHGLIAEDGSYEELMAADGLFAKLARRNLL